MVEPERTRIARNKWGSAAEGGCGSGRRVSERGEPAPHDSQRGDKRNGKVDTNDSPYRASARGRRLWRYLGLHLALERVLRVRRVANTWVDLGAVIKDAPRVGEGLEAPPPVVLSHPRIANTSKRKFRN